MSIYSGFVTRALESNYNRALYNMLFLLQVRIHHTIKKRTALHRYTSLVPFDEQTFAHHFAKLYTRLLSYEGQKHMPPRFSFATRDLAEHYCVFEKLDEGSSLSSSFQCPSNGDSCAPSQR